MVGGRSARGPDPARRPTGDRMKRWWLTIVLAVIALGLSLWLVFRQDEAARLVAAYGRDKAVGPRVVELGPSAVAPLCEALERLPASDLSEAQKQAMINYVHALDAISGGWPYTANQCIPVLLKMVEAMTDEGAKDLLITTIGRSFKQLAVPAMLDVLEDEFRRTPPGSHVPLPSEQIVAVLMQHLGADRCLPVLAARLETTPTDFRRHLVLLVLGFAPDERVQPIVARALEQETDPNRRAWLAERMAGLRKHEGSAERTRPQDAP